MNACIHGKVGPCQFCDPIFETLMVGIAPIFHDANPDWEKQNKTKSKWLRTSRPEAPPAKEIELTQHAANLLRRVAAVAGNKGVKTAADLRPYVMELRRARLIYPTEDQRWAATAQGLEKAKK